MTAKPITEEVKGLLEQPTILSQLPVVFDTGFRFDTLVGHCGKCHCGIDQQLLRGRITRLLPSVALVEAVGACNRCALLTRFNFRVYSDGRVGRYTARGWVEYSPQRSTKHGFLSRLLSRLLQMLGLPRNGR